jgi:hypothetical protein
MLTYAKPGGEFKENFGIFVSGGGGRSYVIVD